VENNFTFKGTQNAHSFYVSREAADDWNATPSLYTQALKVDKPMKTPAQCEVAHPGLK